MPFPARRLVIAAALVALLPAALACTGDERASTRDAAFVYVALGASDGVGAGARNPASEGWVPRLHARMPAGTRLVNLGVGGLTIRQAVAQTLPVALDVHPSVVTVWLAVNDFAAGVPLEAYQRDLDTLLAALARDSDARVYVGNLPDLTQLPAFSHYPRERLRLDVERWNTAIAATAAAHGATLVDLHTGWTELQDNRGEYISRDGLHPSSTGYRRLSELFWQAMQGS